MVEVLVSVEDLGNGPTLLTRRIHAQPPFQRVHGQSFAGLGAGDEVMKVSVGICRPDPLNQHNRLVSGIDCLAATYPERLQRAIMAAACLTGPWMVLWRILSYSSLEYG